MLHVIKSITARDNPLLVKLRKLGSDPSAYRKLGQVWIEGDHLCRSFMQRGGTASQAVITEDAWQQPEWRELACRADAVAVVPRRLMDSVSTLESAPALGFVVFWQPVIEVRGDEPTVVLDRIQDAGNAGAILRSAAAFGFTQVAAMKGTAALWSPKVLRAGMGAHFALRVAEGIDTLPPFTVPLLAASPHATQALDQAVLPWPCAWVMGHEGQGISPALQAACAMRLRIPQPGGEESLNVAAAAAICLYESTRQRQARP